MCAQLPSFTAPPSPILIKAIVLVGDPNQLAWSDFSASGVSTRALTLPSNSKRLKRQLSEALIGELIDGDVIMRGEEIIRTFYREQGHPLVIVSVPKQKITQGVLQFILSLPMDKSRGF